MLKQKLEIMRKFIVVWTDSGERKICDKGLVMVISVVKVLDKNILRSFLTHRVGSFLPGNVFLRL